MRSRELSDCWEHLSGSFMQQIYALWKTIKLEKVKLKKKNCVKQCVYQFWSSVEMYETRVVTRGLESRFYDITPSVTCHLTLLYILCSKIDPFLCWKCNPKKKGSLNPLFLPPPNGIGGTWGGILTSFSCNSPHFPLFCPQTLGDLGKYIDEFMAFISCCKNSGRFCQGRHEVNSALDCN